MVVLQWLVGAAVLVAAVAFAYDWHRRRRLYRQWADSRLAGRQQIGAAMRSETVRQLSGAPVDRKERRTASRELLHRARRRRSEGGR